MDKEKLRTEIKNILIRGGFSIGEPVRRSMIFDFIARRDDIILILKILVNADSLRPDIARELKILGQMFKGAPIIIGMHSGAGEIIDDVVYSRYGVPVISKETFRSYIIDNVAPMVYVAPGGFYVNLDGKLLREIRSRRGISLGEIAAMAGISRRTIQLYEEGMSSTVDIALKLEEYLQTELIEPIDLLNFTDKTEEIASGDDARFHDIYQRLTEMGYNVFLMRKCPFEAISKDKQDVMLTGFEKSEMRLKYKAQNIRIFSEILERRGFIVISESSYEDYNGVAIIKKREIMSYDKEELKKVIEERSGI